MLNFENPVPSSWTSLPWLSSLDHFVFNIEYQGEAASTQAFIEVNTVHPLYLAHQLFLYILKREATHFKNSHKVSLSVRKAQSIIVNMSHLFLKLEIV